MSQRLRANALLVLWALICSFVAGCDREPESREVTPLTGAIMGTEYLIKVIDLPEQFTLMQLDGDIAQLLRGIDASMSTYRDDSELSKFNAAKTTEWVAVSEDVVEVVEHALETSRITGGAFDITVGPLVNLWGFGPDQHPDRVPTEDQIQAEKARAGYQYIHVRKEPPALKKDKEDIYLDLSALAKGYAVDQVADYLESLGIADYMVEIGGELRLSGRNERGMPWRIAVERPTPGVRDIFNVMQLESNGVATSGDYRNYFEQDGQRYSHTIHPRTGKPIDHRLASVTVIAERCMHADAMATALMVLGADEGLALAREQGLAAYLIVKSADGFIAKSTESFEQYLDTNEP